MQLFSFLLGYPFHRIVVAGISFTTAIIAARILPAGEFAALMTAAFIGKFLQVMNLGATAGYFVSRYSGQGALACGTMADERRYLTMFVAQLVVSGGLVALAALFWFRQYLPGTLVFLMMAPLFVLEPCLRYRRMFSFSLLPELLLSVALLVVVAARGPGGGPADIMWLYLPIIAVLSLAAVTMAMRGRFASRSPVTSELSFHEYRRIVLQGGPVYLATAIFLAASSMDRLILPLHATAGEVSLYFLAYQLSVGATVLVTALNFINTVSLGEARQGADRVDSRMVKAKLRAAGLISLACFIALAGGVAVLEHRFLSTGFDGLTHVTLTLGAGLALFYCSNAITPIVAYYHRQTPLTVSMVCVALAVLANNLFAFVQGSGALWLASGTAAALTCHSVFSIWFTFVTIGNTASANLGARQ